MIQLASEVHKQKVNGNASETTNHPGNEAMLDASWQIRDADSAVHPAGYVCM